MVIDEVGDVDDKISLSQFYDSETQTDCTCLSENILSSSSTADQATHVREFPSRPYQCYEVRKRSEIRTELIDKIRDLLDGYVHGDSLALSDLAQDIVQSKKWSSTFGVPERKGNLRTPDKLLCSIIKEYKE